MDKVIVRKIPFEIEGGSFEPLKLIFNEWKQNELDWVVGNIGANGENTQDGSSGGWYRNNNYYPVNSLGEYIGLTISNDVKSAWTMVMHCYSDSAYLDYRVINGGRLVPASDENFTIPKGTTRIRIKVNALNTNLAAFSAMEKFTAFISNF